MVAVQGSNRGCVPYALLSRPPQSAEEDGKSQLVGGCLVNSKGVHRAYGASGFPNSSAPRNKKASSRPQVAGHAFAPCAWGLAKYSVRLFALRSTPSRRPASHYASLTPRSLALPKPKHGLGQNNLCYHWCPLSSTRLTAVCVTPCTAG